MDLRVTRRVRFGGRRCSATSTSTTCSTGAQFCRRTQGTARSGWCPTRPWAVGCSNSALNLNSREKAFAFSPTLVQYEADSLGPHGVKLRTLSSFLSRRVADSPTRCLKMVVVPAPHNWIHDAGTLRTSLHHRIGRASSGCRRLHVGRRAPTQSRPLARGTSGLLDPDLANTLNNLGVVCEINGKPVDAEECFRRAFSIATQALEPDHPFVATSRQNLRDFCEARGKPLELPTSSPAATIETKAPASVPVRPAAPIAVAGAIATAAAARAAPDPFAHS